MGRHWREIKWDRGLGPYKPTILYPWSLGVLVYHTSSSCSDNVHLPLTDNFEDPPAHAWLGLATRRISSWMKAPDAFCNPRGIAPENSNMSSKLFCHIAWFFFPEAITSLIMFVFVKGELLVGNALWEIWGKINPNRNILSQPSAVLHFIILLAFESMLICPITHLRKWGRQSWKSE